MNNKIIRVKTLDHLLNYSPLKYNFTESRETKFRVFTFSEKFSFQDLPAEQSPKKSIKIIKKSDSLKKLLKLDTILSKQRKINSEKHSKNLNQLLYDDQYTKILSIKMEDENPFFKEPKPLKQEIKKNEKQINNILLRRLDQEKEKRDKEFASQNREKLFQMSTYISHSPSSKYYKRFLQTNGHREPNFLKDVEWVKLK